MAAYSFRLGTHTPSDRPSTRIRPLPESPSIHPVTAGVIRTLEEYRIQLRGRMPNYGSKMGIDATRKWKEEGFMRPWPDVIRMPDEVMQRVEQLWKKAGLR